MYINLTQERLSIGLLMIQVLLIYNVIMAFKYVAMYVIIDAPFSQT